MTSDIKTVQIYETKSSEYLANISKEHPHKTLKYFAKRGGKIFLEAANIAYEPIELNMDEVVFQGKLLAVWRKI